MTVHCMAALLWVRLVANSPTGGLGEAVPAELVHIGQWTLQIEETEKVATNSIARITNLAPLW